MKISVDNKPTCTPVGELVEGEAFLRYWGNGEETIYIFVTYQEHDDVVVLLEVCTMGMITRLYSESEVASWRAQPLEITGISFSPSTIRKYC